MRFHANLVLLYGAIAAHAAKLATSSNAITLRKVPKDPEVDLTSNPIVNHLSPRTIHDRSVYEPFIPDSITPDIYDPSIRSGLTSLAHVGHFFIADVTIGGQTFDLLVDTGSSVTWVVRDHHTCILKGERVPSCDFTRYFAGEPSGGWKAGKPKGVFSYLGGHTQIQGPIAYEDVNIAGIDIKEHEVILVDKCISKVRKYKFAGLLGLGYSNPITILEGKKDGDGCSRNGGCRNAWASEGPQEGEESSEVSEGEAQPKQKDQNNDDDEDWVVLKGQVMVPDDKEAPSKQIELASVLDSMWKNRAGHPLFSLAISRGAAESLLAFDGVVPVPLEDGKFVSVPIVDVRTAPWKWPLREYAISPDGFYIARGDEKPRFYSSGAVYSSYGQAKPAHPPYVIDSGSSMMIVPDDIVEAIASAYSPRAFSLNSDGQGSHAVSCDATPPHVGIVMGGQTFWFDEADMFMTQKSHKRRGYCTVPFVSSLGGEFPLGIIGTPLLHSVVSVFDLGEGMMKFAKRAKYCSADSGCSK